MHLLIYLLLIFLLVFFASCEACARLKPHSKEVAPRDPITVEESRNALKKTLDDIRAQTKEIVSYTSKGSPGEKTYHRLVSLISSTQKQIDGARRKLSGLGDFDSSDDELEEGLAEGIEIGVEELEGMQEKLMEEHEEWTSTIAAMFDLKSYEEVEEHISWIYKPNKDGSFLIHEWAYGGGEVLSDNPFVVEKTVDINCKNSEGLTALQIAMGKLIAAEEEEEIKENIEKLDILLGIGADLTVVEVGMLQAVLRILETAHRL